MLKSTAYLSILIFCLTLLGCSKNDEILNPTLDFGFKLSNMAIINDEQVEIPTFKSIQLVNTSVNLTGLNNLIWNLEDRSNTKDLSPVVSYAHAGVYNITLFDAGSSNSSKLKSIKVVDRYAETVQLELTDFRKEESMRNLNQDSLALILRIYSPFSDQYDENIGKQVFESAPVFITGVGKEIRYFPIPPKTATIVPLIAPINKQYVYRIYVKSGENYHYYFGNNPKLGGYSFYEDNFKKAPEFKMFGSRCLMTVIGKYDFFE